MDLLYVINQSEMIPHVQDDKNSSKQNKYQISRYNLFLSRLTAENNNIAETLSLLHLGKQAQISKTKIIFQHHFIFILKIIISPTQLNNKNIAHHYYLLKTNFTLSYISQTKLQKLQFTVIKVTLYCTNPIGQTSSKEFQIKAMAVTFVPPSRHSLCPNYQLRHKQIPN